MPWGSVSAGVGTGLAVALAFAIAWVFRGYTTRETLTMLEQSVRVRDQTIADYRANEAIWEERLDSSAARNMALEVRNRELLNMVTARPELAELRSLLLAQSNALAADHRRIVDQILRLHSAAFFADPRHDRRKGPPDEDQT